MTDPPPTLLRPPLPATQMRVIVAVAAAVATAIIPGVVVVLVNARRLCHTLVHPTRARRTATLPRRIGSVIAGRLRVIVIIQQVRLVLHHLAIDQLLPLLHRVLPLIDAVIVRSRGRLKTKTHNARNTAGLLEAGHWAICGGFNYHLFPTTYRIHFALVVPHVDVAVHERLIDGDALLGVYHQHLAQQVARLTRLQLAMLRRVAGEEHVREEALERVARVPRPVLHVVAHRRLQPRHKRLRRRAQLFCGGGDVNFY